MTRIRSSPSGPLVDIEGLFSVLFVDPLTTLSDDEQTGSAVAPFRTIASAVLALPEREGGTIALCPGDYPAEAIVAAGRPLTLLGLGGINSGTGCNLHQVTFDTESELTLFQISDVGTITSLGRVYLLFSSIRELSCSSVHGQLSHFDSNLTISNGSDAVGCTFSGINVLGDPGVQLSLDQASFTSFVSNGVTLGAGLTLLRNDVVPAHQDLNVDGSAPINFTLLPAGHPPGIYLWSLYLVKKVAGTGGNVSAALNYTDTSGVAQLLRPNASLVGTGHFNLAPFPIYSTGATDLTIDLTFPGITGAPSIDFYNSVVLVG